MQNVMLEICVMSIGEIIQKPGEELSVLWSQVEDLVCLSVMWLFCARTPPWVEGVEAWKPHSHCKGRR